MSDIKVDRENDLGATPRRSIEAGSIEPDQLSHADPKEQALTALEFAAGAIIDAIGCDDGLDGLAGTRVLRMIDDALVANGRHKHPMPTDETYAQYYHEHSLTAMLLRMTRPDPWHPIETAPKDGTRVFIAEPHPCLESPESWFVVEGRYVEGPRETVNGWQSVHLGKMLCANGAAEWHEFQSRRFVAMRPTHWMPLPPPPVVGYHGAKASTQSSGPAQSEAP